MATVLIFFNHELAGWGSDGTAREEVSQNIIIIILIIIVRSNLG